MEDIVKDFVTHKKQFSFLNIRSNTNTKSIRFDVSWGQRRVSPLFIPQSVALEYQELHNKWKDNTLKDNTKVYSTQLSQLPSFKLKNYIEENKLNITFGRKWREINTIIIGDNFINEMFKVKEAVTNQYYVVPFREFKSKFSAYYDSRYIINNAFDREYFLINYNDIEKNITSVPSLNEIKTYPLIKGAIIVREHGNSKAYSQYEFFMNLPQHIKDWDLEVVYDNTLSNEVNKGISIDIDMFSSLLNMLNSSDRGNLDIVKEIMSNVEYEPSEPYLSYLLNIHPKLSVVNGNDNYKFLLKKLKKFTIGTRYDKCTIDEIFKGLTKLAPQYSKEYTQCLKVHLNHIIGQDLIKEIIL